jgi:YNFM family putative membrane transporter
MATVALYLVAVAVFSDMYITQPILPLLAKEFQISAATTGLSVSLVVVMIALASSAYGPLGDALGRKRVMVASCLLLALPTFGCAFASSFGLLLFFRALQGLLIPGVTAVAVAYIGDQFRSADLGSVVGGFISATVAGGLIGRVVSGLIAQFFFWRAAFLLFAAVTLIGGIALALVLPDDQPSASAGWIAAYRGMFAHLRNRRLLGAFLIGGTLFFGFIGVFTYLPYYLSGPPFRLATGTVSSIYVVYLAGVIISPLAGRLSKRISRQAIMAIGLVVAIIGMLGTLINSLPVIIASLVVLCLGMFTAQATAPAFVNATAATAKGGANALYLGFYYLGASFGSVLPGLAWQSWGWHGVVMVCISALILALLSDWVFCRS